MNKGCNMIELKNGSLLTNKYTRVYHEENIEFNAPHHFEVQDTDGKVLSKIDFQCGRIKGNGVNGIFMEDLIMMVVARLSGFQDSEFSCRENGIAIQKLEESLLWLNKRTADREIRNVEGTHTV